VSSTKDNLSAMMIQKMPEIKKNDEEGWNRITALASTITNEELCGLDAEQLLHRLFHEETVQLFTQEQIDYECQQDRKRFEKIIFDLGEEDARNLLKERGEISIHNEICNEHLFFNEHDLDHIFSK
jgi:molecular chaperone Hsp33